MKNSVFGCMRTTSVDSFKFTVGLLVVADCDGDSDWITLTDNCHMELLLTNRCRVTGHREERHE